MVLSLLGLALVVGPRVHCQASDAERRAQVAPSDRDDGAESVELYFELKLLFRGGLRIGGAVDQWAGGRLRMLRRPSVSTAGEPQSTLDLERPLEDPWTFRWYPAKGEAKLGAAVWVARPSGHPYGQLEPLLLPLARRKHREWWDGDRVPDTAPFAPEWANETNGFWAAVHRAERPDPLHREAVYPFHVLGDPTQRVSAVVGARGGVVPGSVRQRMTEPWLERGWDDWRAGIRRGGYGYWDRERPRWEPRTYETLAAALALLGWDFRPSTADDRESYALRVERPDLPRAVAATVEALVPRASSVTGWSGVADFAFERVGRSSRFTEVVGSAEIGNLGRDGLLHLRLWRYGRFGRDGSPVRDELQALLTHAEKPAPRLWIRIGYAPTAAPPR